MCPNPKDRCPCKGQKRNQTQSWRPEADGGRQDYEATRQGATKRQAGSSPGAIRGHGLLTPGFSTSGSRTMRINFCCFEPSRPWDFMWPRWACFPPNLLNSGSRESDVAWMHSDGTRKKVQTQLLWKPQKPCPPTTINAAGSRRPLPCRVMAAATSVLCQGLRPNACSTARARGWREGPQGGGRGASCPLCR